MGRSYKDISSSIKANWSEEAVALSRQAGAYFDAQVAAHRELGVQLAQARNEAHLTQAQLGEIASVQQSEVSRIERGQGNPTVDTLQRLAIAVGKKLSLSSTDGVQHVTA